jgi:F0F1-type ATP synthase membrane subunit b/b'
MHFDAIVFLFVFICFSVIIYRFFWAKAITIIDERIDIVRQNISDAEVEKQFAVKRFEAQQRAFKLAVMQCDEIMDQARAESKKIKDHLTEEMDMLLLKRQQKANHQLQHAKDSVYQELQAKIIDLSIATIKQLVETKAITPPIPLDEMRDKISNKKFS